MSTDINSIRDIAAAARGRRLGLGLSQAEVATRARVSRQWVSEFEAGKPTAELRLAIRLLDALGLRLTIRDLDAAAGEEVPSSIGVVDLDALLDEYRQR